MKPIVARFEWTADDLLAGRKHAGNFGPRKYVFLLGMAMIAVGFVFPFAHSRHLDYDPAALLFTAGLLVVAVAFAFAILLAGRKVNAWIVRRQFAKRPDAGMEIVWELSEDGIHTSSAVSNSELRWAIFQKVISTPVGFLFMPNKQIFHFLPIRAFESAAEAERLKGLADRCATEFKEMK